MAAMAGGGDGIGRTALDAAAELDAAAAGGRWDAGPATALAAYLDTLDVARGGAALAPLFRALVACGMAIASREDLSAALGVQAARLRRACAGEPGPAAAARRFCLALHDAALSEEDAGEGAAA